MLARRSNARLTVKRRFDYTVRMETWTTPDLVALKALADERRLALLALLGDGGERCVCELAGVTGMSDALVSHHVAKLRDAGLVETRRTGRWLHVRAVPGALDEIAERLRGLCCAEGGPAGGPAGGCCGKGGAHDG